MAIAKRQARARTCRAAAAAAAAAVSSRALAGPCGGESERELHDSNNTHVPWPPPPSPPPSRVHCASLLPPPHPRRQNIDKRCPTSRARNTDSLTRSLLLPPRPPSRRTSLQSRRALPSRRHWSPSCQVYAPPTNPRYDAPRRNHVDRRVNPRAGAEEEGSLGEPRGQLRGGTHARVRGVHGQAGRVPRAERVSLFCFFRPVAPSEGGVGMGERGAGDGGKSEGAPSEGRRRGRVGNACGEDSSLARRGGAGSW